MKKSIFFFPILLLNFSGLMAQNYDSLIQEIRKKYHFVQENLMSFTPTIIDISNGSEVGQAKAYFNNSELLMIKAIKLNEKGNTCVEYYFDSSKLIFVVDLQIEFGNSISISKSTEL